MFSTGMPPDSPTGSRLWRSKLPLSSSEVWLRPCIVKIHVFSDCTNTLKIPAVICTRVVLTLHCMSLVADRGILMTFGSGMHGSLGHGNYNDVVQAKIVEALIGFEVEQVRAGL